MRRPVYDGVTVARPFDEALAIFADLADRWLPRPADRIPTGYVVEMRASGLLAAAGVDALVDVGELELDPPGLAARSVAWRALNADRVFPRLVGELELAATNDEASRLTLVGAYQPPVSVVGDAADRLVGRHVAEAVIRTFLEEVAAALAAVPVATRAVT